MRETNRVVPDVTKQVRNLRVDAPTLYLNFGGVLNVGHGLVGDDGVVTLDSGRELFEHAPILINFLTSQPMVQIVLTTSWLQTLGAERTTELLPDELRRRVVGTTRETPPRLAELRDGSAKAWVPIHHARKHAIRLWLALDDEAWGVPSGFEHHFLRTSSETGLGALDVQRKLQLWLAATGIGTD
ncbi:MULTISPECIES: HAD domain-containing protein [unclassified Caballeronia]|uniref:HAD domain-containing protein n=1 Tax=unclassified Caballeronia TaxID=2646786 RepID=UPI003857882A